MAVCFVSTLQLLHICLFVLGHIFAHVYDPGTLDLTSAHAEMPTMHLTESSLSSPGPQLGKKKKYVVALVVFEGSKENMLHPMLPLGPSVSLPEPDALHAARCTSELGHIIAVQTVRQRYGRPGNRDTLRLLCPVI